MIGKKIVELDYVDSTNAYANRLISTGESDDGIVIWAYEQSAGRGQMDHTWISEAGKNLTFSICLRPHFLAPDRQFQLNKAIALGVLDFIRSFRFPGPQSRQPFAHIKWPNDIYVDEEKIGGILIENKIMGSVLDTSIIGIGININQTRFAPDIPNPVSLIHILRHETVLKDALSSLCSLLNKRYMELNQPDPGNLDKEFDQNLMGFDEWRNFLCDGTLLEGKIKGVDEMGRLCVEDRSGETLH
ncbi:MAG: biotin--[acetyl-CoA-carboxylase] ligase, partial [Bacteroidetes bacterium]|nr:biotin--[acetyl-CoA-carboxylase] ligase [Bacteroidota bacterium]